MQKKVPQSIRTCYDTTAFPSPSFEAGIPRLNLSDNLESEKNNSSWTATVTRGLKLLKPRTVQTVSVGWWWLDEVVAEAATVALGISEDP